MIFINILLASVITISMLFISLNIGDRMNEASLQVEEQYGATALQNEILITFKNAVAYQKLLKARLDEGSCNPSFECVDTSSNCFPLNGTWSEVNCLVDPGGNHDVYYRENIDTNGFEINGNPCNEFSTDTPHDKCIFRPIVRWQPICAGDPCNNRPLRVYVEIQVSSKSKVNYNSTRRRAYYTVE